MPRPKKLTLDFFLHDADARGNRKIRSLRRKHGNDGYATYFVLLEMLCQENGLKLSMSDPFDSETVAEECGLRDVAHLHAVIQTCAAIGLLDKQLWESERIVFSHGLYERYMARLEERQKMASRKAKSRAEKSYAERLAERVDEVRAQDPENKNQKSENRDQISDSQISDQSQQDNPVVTRDNPVTTESESTSSALPKSVSEREVDPFFRTRQPIAVAVTPTFQGPWGVGRTQDLTEFDDWLQQQAKTLGKKDPAGWAFKIIDSIAKGGPDSKWREFEGWRKGRGGMGCSVDWRKHPLFSDWLREIRQTSSVDFLYFNQPEESAIRREFFDWANSQNLLEAS